MSERSTYDAEADAAYFKVAPSIGAGESVENVVIERPSGAVVLDLDVTGHLLGVEVVGARSLLTEATIDRLRSASLRDRLTDGRAVPEGQGRQGRPGS